MSAKPSASIVNTMSSADAPKTAKKAAAAPKKVAAPAAVAAPAPAAAPAKAADAAPAAAAKDEKKAKKAAEREKFWLEMKHSPIQVRQETSKKGRSIKYHGNSKCTIQLVPFERNGKGARVFTSCVKAVRSNLAKDKAINIVPGMMCKVAGDAHNMFMIHSIEPYLAHPHR